MEHESLEFKVVMEHGADSEILARANALDIASAAYVATMWYAHAESLNLVEMPGPETALLQRCPTQPNEYCQSCFYAKFQLPSAA